MSKRLLNIIEAELRSVQLELDKLNAEKVRLEMELAQSNDQFGEKRNDMFN